MLHYEEDTCLTNDLHDALVDKDVVSFWKMWRATFDTESKSQVINGLSHQSEIALLFISASCTLVAICQLKFLYEYMDMDMEAFRVNRRRIAQQCNDRLQRRTEK